MAAGRSKRFGSPDKRFALLPSQTSILATTVQQIKHTKLNYRIVVGEADWLNQQFHPFVDDLIALPKTDQGLGHNIAQSLSWIESQSIYDEVTHFMICLADMPYIQSQTYALLAQSTEFFPEKATLLLSPQHQFLSKAEQIKHAGNPVLLHRSWLHAFTKLDGDKGGRSLLLKNPDLVEVLLCHDPGIYQDIDRPSDVLDS